MAAKTYITQIQLGVNNTVDIQDARISEIATQVQSGNTNPVTSGAVYDAVVRRGEMGSSGGVATLGEDGKVPSSQLPSYVDDVLEYSSKTGFPTTGETGKIYVSTDNNKTWRWSGTTYVEISESLSLGETSATAYRGDRGKIAYDHSQAVHARTDATKVEASETNGNIKINGTETTVYTLPSSDPYTSARTPASHSHGNIANGGTLKDTAAAAAGNDYVVIRDADNNKIQTSTIKGTDVADAVSKRHTHSNATQETAGLMSAADKTKLDGIAENANNYSHPTSAGNKHIPSGGATGKILGYGGSSGTASWIDKPSYTASEVGAATSDHTHTTSIATSTAENQITLAASTKYSITAGGTSYVFTTPPNTVYTHPTTAGNKHIPAGGSSGQLLGYDSAGTAKWVNKPTYTASEVGAATSGHTHTTSIATSTGTSGITLEHGGKYSISAGGTSFIFTMPSDNNTVTSINGKTGAIAAGDIATVLTDAGYKLTDTVYTHPTSAGNKHIPSGGSSGQLLGYSSSGTAKWVNKPTYTASEVGAATSDHTHTTTIATSTAESQITLTAGGKFAINVGGTSYVFTMPSDSNTHYTTRIYAGESGTAANKAATSPYLKVTDNNSYRNQVRFVGDGATTVTSDDSGNITISSTDTVYTHPTSAGNKHIPSGGSSGQLLGYDSAGTAKWVNKPTYTASEVGASASGHTHTTTIATSTGTSGITLEHGGKYSISTGGTSFIFTMPSDNNTVTSINGKTGVIAAGDIATVLTDAGYKLTDTVYTHPTSAGNKHIPAGGSSGQLLGYSSSGTAAWVNKPSYTASEVGAATSGHTHDTSIAASDGTNQITLAASTKYAITAGGTSYVFTTPPNTVYTHPTTAGNKHIPSGGATGKILGYGGSSGTASWIDKPTYTASEVGAATSGHTHATSIATSTGTSGITLEHGGKYSITAGGTSFIFTMPSDNNTVTSINGKTGAIAAGDIATVLTGAGYKLTDTVYTHPTSAGNKHIPSGGSSGQLLGYDSDGTAKWVNKPSYTASEVGAATSGHTHATSIAASDGTNQITLAASTKYAITAGGTSYVFTTPPNTIYTHPTTSGNKHIPSGGSSGQLLGWSADGTAAWVSKPSYTASEVGAATSGHTHSAATTSAAGFMSAADKLKLDRIQVVTSMPASPDANTIYIVK